MQFSSDSVIVASYFMFIKGQKRYKELIDLTYCLSKRFREYELKEEAGEMRFERSVRELIRWRSRERAF